MDTSVKALDDLAPLPQPVQHGPSRFVVPSSAVDAHAHLVGDTFVANRSYTPPPASQQQYLQMLDDTGMTYGVLVQISVHGTDNSVMVEALRANRDRLRGIAVVAPDISDRALADLKEAGVVGVRLNTTVGGGVGFQNIDRYEAMCAELGWHLQLLATTSSIETVANRLRRLTVPYVIDHMGDVDVEAGLDSPGWRLLLGLVADGAWTKVSGAFRLSDPPYTATVPFARQLLEVAPDRCVWGSDWPQVGFWGPMPNNGDLLDVLGDYAPDETLRTAVLVDNPHQLYGFPKVEPHGSHPSV